MGYLRFIVQGWRLLGFGFVMSFGSSFGQTFYISLSGADLRAEFGLSHGGFGTAFTVATLASGVALIWAGRLIDRLDLRFFTFGVVGGLIGAMAALSFVTSIGALVGVLFMLRFCGQGLMVHTASTTMVRYFDRDRGKALSVAMLGQPVGEAALPLAAVAAIAAVGWRDAWLNAALIMATVCALLLPALLRGHGARHREFLARTAGDGKGTVRVRRQ
jgi:MFS family permease